VIHLGDFVTYEERVYRLVGVTPMSVRPFAVQLQDLTTDEVLWVQADPTWVVRSGGRVVADGRDVTQPLGSGQDGPPALHADRVAAKAEHRPAAWQSVQSQRL
jgi:hypothetical protein